MTIFTPFKLITSCFVTTLKGASNASAQPAMFKDADLKLGMQLIAEKKS